MTNPSLKKLPYTKMIVDKVVKEIMEVEAGSVNSNLGTEFLAGCNFIKDEIIKRIDKIEFL